MCFSAMEMELCEITFFFVYIWQTVGIEFLLLYDLVILVFFLCVTEATSF